MVLTLLHGLALAAVFSVLQECARVCPILAKYFRHRAFPMEQVEGKGKKKLRRQVAGAAPALPALLSSQRPADYHECPVVSSFAVSIPPRQAMHVSDAPSAYAAAPRSCCSCAAA